MAFYRPTKKHNSLFFINSSNKGKTEKFQETKSDQGKDKYEHHQSTVGYFTLSTLLFQPSHLSVFLRFARCFDRNIFSNHLITFLLSFRKSKIFPSCQRCPEQL